MSFQNNTIEVLPPGMKEFLEKKIRETIVGLQETEALPPFDIPFINVERPKEDQFGEYTSNIALVLSKLAKKNPMDIAQAIESSIKYQESSEAAKTFEKIECVAPGYLNFYVSQSTLATILENVLREESQYGGNGIGKGVKVNNEFISANPTGPLHLGNARGGFYADALSRVLRKSGFDVTNEYYVNDAGEQIQKLGHSVLKDGEAVYGGEYIDELAGKFAGAGDVSLVGEQASKYVLDELIKPTLTQKMHINFDAFTSERKLIVDGFVEKALTLLKKNGYTYESDGAMWLRSTDFGDDKDRVLIKENGEKTYIASDCGHILWYMENGVSMILETFGADHHGYIKRFHAVAQALGFRGKVDFILVQLVQLVKNGEEVRMSKRAGNVVTIDDLIDRVGHDVARFFFLMYAPETHMTFDLGLAEERSQKNPVFYVQYAHARLASILRKAKEEGVLYEDGNLTLLTHQKERELIRELMFFPELIQTVATDFSVHKLPQYAIRLADKLHSFYNECRVLDVENSDLTKARLRLIVATKVVMKETLDIMGVSAPEEM